MGLLIAGSILVIVGFGLWVSMKKKVGQSAHLSSTDTLNVSEIDENYRSITNAVGSGNFTLYCEVKGAAFSENPIKGELSGEEVVYCKSQVIHKFERLESKKDSQGKTQKKWVKHSDIVSTNEQWSDQWGVKDSSGFMPTFDKIGKTTSNILPFGKAMVNLLFAFILCSYQISCLGFNLVGQGTSISSIKTLIFS